MSFMDFDKFVENTSGQLADWAVIQLGNVAEATVHPRFADFLRYIRRESDATIHIVTNGKLLGRYAQLINETGNYIVQISMDSVDKATHEYIREGSDYDRVLEVLAMLDVSRTQVLLSFTLMASNIGQYDDMVAFCAERGYKMSAFPMILREEQGVIPYQLLRESLWFKRDALGGWLRRHYGQSYEGIVKGSAPGTLAVPLTEFNCDAHNQDLTLSANGVTMLCGMSNLANLMSAPLEGMWQ